jgi:hypothetical protein
VAVPEQCTTVIVWLHILQAEMYEAIQLQQQPSDATLRHPSGSSKAVGKLAAHSSKQGAAASEEGAALVAQLRRKRKGAGAAAQAGARAKRSKVGGRGQVVLSEDSEDGENSLGMDGECCSEEGACNEAAADGTTDDEWDDQRYQQLQLQKQQQQQQQPGMGAVPHRAEGRRPTKIPQRYQQ